MIHKSDSDTTVRRFDLSQQFTAMQRISPCRDCEALCEIQDIVASAAELRQFRDAGCRLKSLFFMRLRN